MLVIRHAIAEDRVEFARSGKPDEERPLTSVGRSRMERASRGLQSIVPTIDLIASSPLERAKQTADVVAAVYGKPSVQIVSALSGGGDLGGIAEWLNTQREREVVALVGHEPDLSALISYLLTGVSSAAIAMKKGAACLLEFDADVEPGKAVLRWFLAPKHLRAIGDSHA